MANTIDWGKASVNNTNGYGKGAIDNTIRWGKIYESSASGETNIGTATTPSYSNTKSVRYDGVDDFVTMGNVLATSNTGADAFSISCWYKTSQQATQMIVARMLNLGPFSGYALNMVSNNMLSFFLGTFSGNAYINVRSNSVATHSDGNWHHLAVTYDGSRAASGVTMYFDNSVLLTNTIRDVAPNNINAQSPDFMIGCRGNSSSSGFTFNGNIDEVAYFTSELTSSDIATIYNSGVPSDISTLNPVGWWRMGDGDTFPTLNDNGSGGNNGTMTNMTSGNIVSDVPIELFSRKSIELDGADDFVNCGTTLESWIERSNKSFSAWVKNNGNTTNSRIFNAPYLDSGSATGFALGLQKTTQNKPYYFLRQSDGTLLFEEFGDVLNTSDWYHFAISIDGTANEAYIYQNGVLKVTVANVGNPAQVSVQTAKIGKHWDSTINQYFDGYVDELALFNTTLTQSDITAIYGSGVPSSLATYNPFLWYRCGDGDTAPTLTDNGSGGNNGTMTNFSTFSTDVPT